MNQIRRGEGRPLLLIHGLGGSWRSWTPVLNDLAVQRRVIAVDLPGFGKTPPLPGEVSMATLADAMVEWLVAQDLIGVDVVGSSMGARLVLELARRGAVGSVVSLSPGGFWEAWERAYFFSTIAVSIQLVRVLQAAMPFITGSPIGRTLMFSQLSARPWDVPADLLLDEMRCYAASPSFDELLYNLAFGPAQEGAGPESPLGPITIGWGRKDRVCFPGQAARAQERFPTARLHWFEDCGHFPHWDVPQQAARLILSSTGQPQSGAAGLENSADAGLRERVVK